MTTHGLRSHPLYGKWWDMKSRCYRPNRDRYNCYGGRGIKVCDEWKDDFKAFYDWAIAAGWKEGLTLDRIDVDGNYEPSNCKWVTKHEQAQNRQNTIWVTYKGVTKNLKEWSSELGIKYLTLYMRINKYGWSIEQAFTTPVKRKDDN